MNVRVEYLKDLFIILLNNFDKSYNHTSAELLIIKLSIFSFHRKSNQQVDDEFDCRNPKSSLTTQNETA